MGRSKLSFTLVELFLTIALITMVSGLLLIRAKPMLENAHFKQGVAKLEREINFSKHLSEGANADIEFLIEVKNGGLLCIRNTDEPLKLSRALHTPIHIPHIYLEGVDKVQITFTSSGAFRGNQTFIVTNGKEKKHFDFSSSVEKKRAKSYDEANKFIGDDHDIENRSF